MALKATQYTPITSTLTALCNLSDACTALFIAMAAAKEQSIKDEMDHTLSSLEKSQSAAISEQIKDLHYRFC